MFCSLETMCVAFHLDEDAKIYGSTIGVSKMMVSDLQLWIEVRACARLWLRYLPQWA